jgi:hypothetical protein
MPVRSYCDESRPLYAANGRSILKAALLAIIESDPRRFRTRPFGVQDKETIERLDDPERLPHLGTFEKILTSTDLRELKAEDQHRAVVEYARRVLRSAVDTINMNEQMAELVLSLLEAFPAALVPEIIRRFSAPVIRRPKAA